MNDMPNPMQQALIRMAAAQSDDPGERRALHDMAAVTVPGQSLTNHTEKETPMNTPEPAPDTLERAIWRGDKLVALGADEGEPSESQLSDVLADLMHWADHNHVDFDAAVAQAERARQAELADWDLVLVSITNTYEDGHESETEVWVPAPEGMPDEDWWQDVVEPHTGDGHGADHPKLGFFYEATIIRVNDEHDTTMCGLTNEWDG